MERRETFCERPQGTLNPEPCKPCTFGRSSRRDPQVPAREFHVLSLEPEKTSPQGEGGRGGGGQLAWVLLEGISRRDL